MKEINSGYGIPLASYNDKSSPSLDNATWFSTVGAPPYPAPQGHGWEFNAEFNYWKLTHVPVLKDETP